MKVLWFGYHKERQYFISVDDNIYEIEYEHKFLRFVPTKCDKTEYFNDSEEEISDNIVKIYSENNVGVTIGLKEYFEKGFFYKGPKWNRYWHDFLYPHDITMLIAISAQDGLFHIEIENITYPHRGYVLLDLRELRIIEAKNGNDGIMKFIKDLSDIRIRSMEVYDEIENYSVEKLENLAVTIYEKSHLTISINNFINHILSKRAFKLNKKFTWSEENKQKLLKVNDDFMEVFEKAYKEALSAADELEERIKNSDPFIKDYEIKIAITPYLNETANYDELKGSIELVLSEPFSNFFPIDYNISHCHYDSEREDLPIFLDKSSNWNSEYFWDVFKNEYICYAIHTLLDYRWSFRDIINIGKIWVDVEVTRQYFMDEIGPPGKII
jgi:hypothetical protein